MTSKPASVFFSAWADFIARISAKTALILGATGQTGSKLLKELLDSPTYTRVLEAGRRVTSLDILPATAKGKLEQRVVNFEKLGDAKLGEGFDVVYITCVPLRLRPIFYCSLTNV